MAATISQETFVLSTDVSLGLAKYPIRIVAPITEGITKFPQFEYRIEPEFQKPVKLADRQFCNCVDGCSATSGCLCVNLSTVKFAKMGKIDEMDKISGQNPFASVFYECTSECACAGKCENHLLNPEDEQSKRKYQVEIYRTKAVGYSCRTLRSIRKGSFVCYLAGEIILDSSAAAVELRRNTANDCFTFTDETRQLGFSVRMKRLANESRFFNSSCCPNLLPIFVYRRWATPQCPIVAFVALNEIAPNEDLCFYYGDHWMLKNVLASRKFFCRCNSPFFCVWPRQKTKFVEANIEIDEFIEKARSEKKTTNDQRARERHDRKKRKISKSSRNQSIEEGNGSVQMMDAGNCI